MYTNPQYLRIRNLSERGAAVAILASIGKLTEKKRTLSDSPFSVKASSPKLTKNAQIFLSSNLKSNFKEIAFRFIEKTGMMVVTITPK